MAMADAAAVKEEQKQPIKQEQDDGREPKQRSGGEARDEYSASYGPLLLLAKKFLVVDEQLRIILLQAQDANSPWAWARTCAPRLQAASDAAKPSLDTVRSAVVLVRPLVLKKTHGDSALQTAIQLKTDVVDTVERLGREVAPSLRMQT